MKKGYTKFDNEILEALIKADINSTELKVMLVIIRYSYGYQRDSCNLAVNYIAKICNRSNNSIKNSLKKLCEKNYIIKEIVVGKRILSYKINCEYLLDRYGTKSDTLTVQKTVPYKDNNINKNNIYNKHSNFCVPTPRATAFSNFTPRSGIDYDALEKKALQQKIDKIACKTL